MKLVCFIHIEYLFPVVNASVGVVDIRCSCKVLISLTTLKA